MYNTENTHKDHKNKEFRKRNPEKSAKVVISLALSVININLAGIFGAVDEVMRTSASGAFLWRRHCRMLLSAVALSADCGAAA